ncbi:hypothetical protein B0H19DRAFT_569356 [Mycena capillaripes]|nr:hypothetical protein B0H19DRAFT_569356 [Mycena capillaripes]
MDFGHRTFWLSLVKQRDELETLLARLEGRGYDLVLESQNASWVRDQEAYSGCCQHDEATSGTTEEGATASAESNSSPSTAADDGAAYLWEQVRWQLATYMLPVSSRFYEERKRVVWAYVCRAIYTDATLMPYALNHADVPSFLASPNHDIPTAMKLKQRLKAIPITEIRAAIDDVLRPVDGSGKYVTVLGVRVHKAPSGGAFPFHAWGHLFAFRPCSGCIRSVCQTVDEIVASSRYALLTGSAPFRCRLRPGLDDISGIEILVFCGLVVQFLNTGKRVTVTKRVQPDKTAVWEEDKRPPVLCAALSNDDPKANEFLNKLLRRCLTYKHLAIILRKSRDEPVIRSAAHIPNLFQRTSNSLAGLITQPWNPISYFADSLLEALHPHKGCKSDPQIRKTYTELDCMQFVVLDSFTGDGDEKYIVADLLVIWKAIYNARTFRELCDTIAKSYMVDGELEVDPERPERPLMSNLESGSVAYKALWGSFPRWTEDQETRTFRTVWDFLRVENA